MGSHLQVYRVSSLDSRVAAECGHLNKFLFPPPVHPLRSVASVSVHQKVGVLSPLNIKSQSENEKLIWLSPKMA